jgi:glucosylceramidase
VAWHCYAGNSNTPTDVRNQHPSKDVYFTECSGGQWDTDFGSGLGWNLENLFIGQTRQGARSVLLWNMALDENYGPRVGVTGGCADCRGVLTVPTGAAYSRNVEYYSIAHFSKFIRQGAQRMNSAIVNDLHSAAFANPDGSVAVVVTNLSWNQARSFQLSLDWEYFTYNDLPPRSVITFVRY